MLSFLYKFLHILSKLACYTIAFCITFLIQFYTIGLIPSFKNITVGNLYLKDIFFILISLIIVIKFVSVSTPYEKYIGK